jgi:hypothetical protein
VDTSSSWLLDAQLLPAVFSEGAADAAPVTAGRLWQPGWAGKAIMARAVSHLE